MSRFVLMRTTWEGLPVELQTRDVFRSRDEAESARDGWRDYLAHRGLLAGFEVAVWPVVANEPDQPVAPLDARGDLTDQGALIPALIDSYRAEFEALVEAGGDRLLITTQIANLLAELFTEDAEP